MRIELPGEPIRQDIPLKHVLQWRSKGLAGEFWRGPPTRIPSHHNEAALPITTHLDQPGAPPITPQFYPFTQQDPPREQHVQTGQQFVPESERPTIGIHFEPPRIRYANAGTSGPRTSVPVLRNQRGASFSISWTHTDFYLWVLLASSHLIALLRPAPTSRHAQSIVPHLPTVHPHQATWPLANVSLPGHDQPRNGE